MKKNIWDRVLFTGTNEMLDGKEVIYKTVGDLKDLKAISKKLKAVNLLINDISLDIELDSSVVIIDYITIDDLKSKYLNK